MKEFRVLVTFKVPLHFISNSSFEVELSIQNSNFIVIVITEKEGKFIIKEQAIRIFVLEQQ